MSSATSTETGANELPPWVFFALAAFGCATALLFVGQDQTPTGRIALTALMGAVFFVGVTAVRALRPLFSNQVDRIDAVAGRTRAAFEREKTLTLRAIKDLEFDRAMGKLSQEDFIEMTTRMRARAARLMKALDAAAGYREQVERDLAKRVQVREAGPAVVAGSFCTQCGTKNDGDARFCKACGHKL